MENFKIMKSTILILLILFTSCLSEENCDVDFIEVSHINPKINFVKNLDCYDIDYLYSEKVFNRISNKNDVCNFFKNIEKLKNIESSIYDKRIKASIHYKNGEIETLCLGTHDFLRKLGLYKMIKYENDDYSTNQEFNKTLEIVLNESLKDENFNIYKDENFVLINRRNISKGLIIKKGTTNINIVKFDSIFNNKHLSFLEIKDVLMNKEFVTVLFYDAIRNLEIKTNFEFKDNSWEILSSGINEFKNISNDNFTSELPLNYEDNISLIKNYLSKSSRNVIQQIDIKDIYNEDIGLVKFIKNVVRPYNLENESFKFEGEQYFYFTYLIWSFEKKMKPLTIKEWRESKFYSL